MEDIMLHVTVIETDFPKINDGGSTYVKYEN